MKKQIMENHLKKLKKRLPHISKRKLSEFEWEEQTNTIIEKKKKKDRETSNFSFY